MESIKSKSTETLSWCCICAMALATEDTFSHLKLTSMSLLNWIGSVYRREKLSLPVERATCNPTLALSTVARICLLFVMFDISPWSDLGDPLPFVTGNPRFSRCSCKEYSSYESRARGWSGLCRVSLLHALQRLRSLALPAPGPKKHRPRPMGGAIRK